MTLRLACFVAAAVAAAMITSKVDAEGERFREWSDRTGQFSVDASLVRSSDDEVVLLLRDGREITVPRQKLSSADKNYLKANAIARPAGGKPLARIAPLQANQPSTNRPKDTESPRSPAAVRRMTQKMRSPDQVIELYEWALQEFADEDDRQEAATQLGEWQTLASQGMLRHGRDWISPTEIDQRLADEVRLLKEAHRLIDVKNDRLALQKFQDASRVNPEGIRADFYLGLLNGLVSGSPIKAARHFDECVDRLDANPDRLIGARRANLVAALNNVAVAQVRTKKFDRAIRNWDNAIELSPQTPELVQNLGRLTQFGGTGAGSSLPNRIGDKAGELYAQATVANGSRAYDDGVGWLYMPLIDNVDGTMQEAGDNELQLVGWSTGVAVAPDLVLVTARTVADADKFRVSGGASGSGVLVSLEQHSNLALIRVPRLNARPIVWAGEYPHTGAEVSVVGFSQPGYGAEGIRSLPSAVLDLRDHLPYEINLYQFNPIKVAGGVAGVFGKRTLAVGSTTRLLQHRFVGDPGLIGSPLCDESGAAVGVHLGSRSTWSTSGSRSSLAASAKDVLDYLARAKVTTSEGSVALDGSNTDPFGRTVFQVAALKYAPRLQWSHRIAKLHSSGGRTGWASYEDNACMACNGAKSLECANRNCKRGRITKYRTVVTKGKGAFEGSTFTKRVPYKGECPSCRGRGVRVCPQCGGNGIQ